MIRCVHALKYEVYLQLSDEIPELFEILSKHRINDNEYVSVRINENVILKSYGDGCISFDLGGNKTLLSPSDFSECNILVTI